MRLPLYSGSRRIYGNSAYKVSRYAKLCKDVFFGLVPHPIMLLKCRRKQPDVIRLLFHVAGKKEKKKPCYFPRLSRYAEVDLNKLSQINHLEVFQFFFPDFISRALESIIAVPYGTSRRFYFRRPRKTHKRVLKLLVRFGKP